MVSLEWKWWSNSQYSSHGCLEISRFPESLKNEDLEGTVLKIFGELNVVVDLSNVEDGCCVASSISKMVIMKLFTCKDANQICRVKKNFNNVNLSSLGIQNGVFINGSLRCYYKMLWSKCKKLSSKKSVYAFWVSKSSVRLQTEN